MWMIVAQVPVPSSTRTDTSATFENRGTTIDRPATRRRRPQAEPEDEQPDQTAEPERAGDQVQPVERQRQTARGGLRRVSARAGDEQDRDGGEQPRR